MMNTHLEPCHGQFKALSSASGQSYAWPCVTRSQVLITLLSTKSIMIQGKHMRPLWAGRKEVRVGRSYEA